MFNARRELAHNPEGELPRKAEGVTTGKVLGALLTHPAITMTRTAKKFAMWIPGPLYESLPYLYTLGGVLFISGTLYIGINTPGSPLYIGCGLVSIVYGAYIFKLRTEARVQSEMPGSLEGT
jgi:hypothetical protein